MKIMIFGASGYIGQKLCEHLVSRNYDVVAVTRSGGPSPSPTNSSVVLTSTSEAAALIMAVSPDLVINVSNYFSRTDTPSDMVKFADVNTTLMASICKGCVDSGAALVHVGSAWEATFTDDDPSLGNTYAMFKGLASKIAKWYRHSFGLRYAQLNLFDTYGPGDTRGKIVQFLVEKIGKSERLDLSGGEQILELVHVDDVVRCIEAVAKLTIKENAKNLVIRTDFACFPNSPVTLKSVVETIESEIGQELPLNWGARPYRTGEMFDRDLRGMATVPGWSQQVSLQSGIHSLLK